MNDRAALHGRFDASARTRRHHLHGRCSSEGVGFLAIGTGAGKAKSRNSTLSVRERLGALAAWPPTVFYGHGSGLASQREMPLLDSRGRQVQRKRASLASRWVSRTSAMEVDMKSSIVR